MLGCARHPCVSSLSGRAYSSSKPWLSNFSVRLFSVIRCEQRVENNARRSHGFMVKDTMSLSQSEYEARERAQRDAEQEWRKEQAAFLGSWNKPIPSRVRVCGKSARRCQSPRQYDRLSPKRQMPNGRLILPTKSSATSRSSNGAIPVRTSIASGAVGLPFPVTRAPPIVDLCEVRLQRPENHLG